ncbi:MAG TPA: hypothetical protein VJQ54_02620, partial [Candidatus Sulfotelmatobacter sp.]|nr:hypothetical protein [Candidatus Sulfotelmatobacter sp.]
WREFELEELLLWVTSPVILATLSQGFALTGLMFRDKRISSMRNVLHIQQEKNFNSANNIHGNLLSLSTYSTMTEIAVGMVFACI